MDVAQTPGITVDGDGRRVLDKEHRGVRIYARLGRVNQAAAERRLETEIQRVESQITRRSNCPPGSRMPRQGTSSGHAISEASTLRLGTFDY